MSRYLRIISIVIPLLYASSLAEKPRYLHVAVVDMEVGKGTVCGGSLWFDVEQEDKYSGVYYVSSDGCGITSQSSRYQSDDLKFELMFDLALIANDEDTWVSGSSRALSYSDKNRSGRAERSSTERAIELGQLLLVSSHVSGKGRQVNLYVEIAEELPVDCADCGISAVVLSSTFSRNGTKFHTNRSGRRLLAEALEFHSSIDAGAAGPGSPQMSYAVMIQIPGALGALREPTSCQVTFMRAYQIQSVSKQSDAKEFAVSYNSKNVKNVVLEPGKELRLVFPPDSPAVEGFDIEDTLIILPK